MNTIRDRASVTVSEPVPNVERRRQYGRRQHHAPTTQTVDTRVLAAAHRLRASGSSSCLRTK